MTFDIHQNNRLLLLNMGGIHMIVWAPYTPLVLKDMLVTKYEFHKIKEPVFFLLVQNALQ